ncbi:MAG: class I SAM-dependent RNA methyltransferase, partial [Bdellovibrionales bacterium]|nr:TRAM domain-containing protein [Bdellovibrionales bacterium]NQZ20316.1 class I SAM-dependent RNA methyltransferase [Bdellovibrionales bacterium]
MQSIEKGSVLELKIDSLANSGDGVGRFNGQVVFVPHSCPDDLLKIKITFKKKNFFKGTILEVLEPGPSRQDPPCEYAGECGGCDWQHVTYEEQLNQKEQGLKQTLQRLGKVDPQLVVPIQPSPKTLGYRNRIQLQHDKKGFFYNQKGSHNHVYVDQCLLAHPLINQNLEERLKLLNKKKGKVELAVMDNSVETFIVDEKGNSTLGFRQINDEQNEFLIKKTLEVVESTKAQRVVDLYCGQGNWSVAIHNHYPHVHCLGIESNPISVGKAQDRAEPNLEFVLGKVEGLYS